MGWGIWRRLGTFSDSSAPSILAESYSYGNMENFSILIGIIFWPTLAVGWFLFCRATKRSRRILAVGCIPLVVLPAIGALSLGWWMLVDEPLYFAASRGDAKEVSRLLAIHANPNVEWEGEYPLVSAAEDGHTEVVKLLIQAGARLNVRDDHRGKTPLEAAKANNHADIVRILREAGATR